MQAIITATDVLNKIRTLTGQYLVSRMPIRLAVLENDLSLSRAELLPHLEELRGQDLVFYDQNYVLLSMKGAG